MMTPLRHPAKSYHKFTIILSQVYNRHDITFLLNAQDAIRQEFTHVKPLLQTFA